jgi:hypothetical protein
MLALNFFLLPFSFCLILPFGGRIKGAVAPATYGLVRCAHGKVWANLRRAPKTAYQGRLAAFNLTQDEGNALALRICLARQTPQAIRGGSLDGGSPAGGWLSGSRTGAEGCGTESGGSGRGSGCEGSGTIGSSGVVGGRSLPSGCGKGSSGRRVKALVLLIMMPLLNCGMRISDCRRMNHKFTRNDMNPNSSLFVVLRVNSWIASSSILLVVFRRRRSESCDS